MKKKMDELTKLKLFYSGELLIIGVIVLIIGILQISNVMHINPTFRQIFNWVTIIASPMMIIHTLYSFINKKKREKISYLDKITLLPLGIYLITIDIICFINWNALDDSFYQLYIPIALIYVGIIYIIQSIYHYYHPLQTLIDELEKEKLLKISFTVKQRNEDESLIAINLEDNKEYLFIDANNIKEEVGETFNLNQYPNNSYELNKIEEIK